MLIRLASRSKIVSVLGALASRDVAFTFYVEGSGWDARPCINVDDEAGIEIVKNMADKWEEIPSRDWRREPPS